MKNKTGGFTLVEIMFVVFIVALLTSLIIVEGANLKKAANDANAQANLKSIAASFEIYAAGHAGLYAESNQANLQFLVDARCASQDFIAIGRVGNFNYVLGSIGPTGYDIRAMAVNENLAGHNYQILTGAAIKRSATASPGDTNFESY